MSAVQGFDLQRVQRLRKLALRSLRTGIVDDAGHMLHHDQPEAVARIIEEFFSQ